MVGKVGEVTGFRKASEVTDVVTNGEVCEVSDISEVSEVNDVFEVYEFCEVGEVIEVSKVNEFVKVVGVGEEMISVMLVRLVIPGERGLPQPNLVPAGRVLSGASSYQHTVTKIATHF